MPCFALSLPAVPSVPDGGSDPTWHGGDQGIRAVSAGHEADSTLISTHVKGTQQLNICMPGPLVPPETWTCSLAPFGFLLLLPSPWRISEHHALLVHRNCCREFLDGKRMFIWLNPAILPKALSKFHLFQSTELQTASTKSLDQEAAQCQAALCSGL